MDQSVPSGGEIFIVDDDPAIRQMLSIVFAQAGFHTTCFAEGAALLASAHLVILACIILDVNIPGRSGLDILKQLNAEDYPAPIFVISGEGDIPMAVDAIRNGALDFIEKPFRAAPSSPGSRRASRLEAASKARHGLHYAIDGDFTTRAADPPRARRADPDRRRCFQQGSRPAARNKSPNGRVSSGADRREVRCQEHRRPDPDRHEPAFPR